MSDNKTTKNASLVADLTSFTDEQLAAELASREEARINAIEAEQAAARTERDLMVAQVRADIEALVGKGMEHIRAAQELSKEHNLPLTIDLGGRSLTYDAHNEYNDNMWVSSSDNC
jgi:hypothetical protein